MARGATPVEDDSGGLHMAMTDGGRRIEAASNREMAAPGRMLADLSAALAEGMDVWQDSVGDPQRRFHGGDRGAEWRRRGRRRSGCRCDHGL